MTEDEQPDEELRAVFARIERLCGEVPADFRAFMIVRRLEWIANDCAWASVKVAEPDIGGDSSVAAGDGRPLAN